MNLVEITIVMVLISLFSVNAPRTFDNDPFEIERFKSEYLHHQFIAITFQQTEHLEAQWGVDLRFNSNGSVNHPYRISFDQTDFVIVLGTGRFYEQRLLDD